MGTDVRFGLHQQVNPGAIGTQDFTDATGLGGATGKGAIFFGSTAAAVNTERTNYYPYIGATDGVNQFAVGVGDNTGAIQQGGSRRAATTRCLMVNNSGTLTYSAAFSAFITNGVRVNFTVVDAAIPRLSNAILIAGADALIKVGTLTLSNSLNGDVVVDLSTGSPTWPTTALPHIVMFVTHHIQFNDSSSGGTTFGVGFAHNGGSVTQRGYGQAGNLISNPTRYDAIFRSDRVYCQSAGGHGGNLVNFVAAPNPGFTVRSTLAGLGGVTLGYVALHFGDLQSSIFDLLTPTSFGTTTITTGYEPQFLFTLQTMMEGTLPIGVANNGNAGAWGVSAVLPHKETCMAGWAKNGVGSANGAAPDNVTNVGQIQDTKAAHIRPHTGVQTTTTDDIQATGPSGGGAFNSTNAVLAFSEVHTAAKRWAGFAVEKVPAVVVLVKKYRIPTNAADGTQRRLYVYSDTSLTTVLVSNVLVTAAGGFFKYEDATLVLGVTRPAALLAFGADATTAAFGGACWASAIEEAA